MTEEFKEMMVQVNRCYEIAKSRPIGIRVNEEWLDKQIKSNVILEEESDRASSFVGFPVYIDNTIESYEFIWR